MAKTLNIELPDELHAGIRDSLTRLMSHVVDVPAAVGTESETIDRNLADEYANQLEED